MSDKKKKNIPAQEPEQETAAPVTEETEDKEVPAEEAAPEEGTADSGDDTPADAGGGAQ